MVVIDEHDLHKTRIEILMDLVYESTGMRIPQHEIKYGQPIELDQRPDLMTDPNTFIPVRINPDYNYRLAGYQRGFMYRRRYLTEHFAGLELDLEFTVWPTTLRQIIMDQINPQLRYPLQPEDFVDYEITDESTDVLLIKTQPHSLFWTGSINVNIVPPGQEYFVLVEQPYLSGFNQWQPEPEPEPEPVLP